MPEPASAPASAVVHPAIAQEARRILVAARRCDVPVRLLGGLAVHLHATRPHPAFARPYKDIDLVTARGRGGDVAALLEGLGYAGADEFNALNGHRRLMYGDERTGRQIDVFVERFEMCHRIPVAERLGADDTTVPLAELLLTKLQIVELNERDVVDAAALLHDHDLAGHDRDAINEDRVAELCAADWGLWRTATGNLDRVVAGLPALALEPAEREAIAARVGRLRARIDAEPKSRAWRLRDRVGERKRWYDLPEEVD